LKKKVQRAKDGGEVKKGPKRGVTKKNYSSTQKISEERGNCEKKKSRKKGSMKKGKKK